MRSNWGDLTFEFCYDGSYGSTLSDLLATKQEPFVFLDIGANQGLYSLVAAANPQCVHVYAFEPVADTLALLEENVQLNQRQGKVTIFPFGISDRNEELPISVKAGHSGGSSLHHSVGSATEMIAVRSMAGLNDRIIPEGLPIVVKIDVEGHESVVLSEMCKSPLLDRVSTIFYEVDEGWCDPSELAALIPDFELRKVGNGTHYDVLAIRK